MTNHKDHDGDDIDSKYNEEVHILRCELAASMMPSAAARKGIVVKDIALLCDQWARELLLTWEELDRAEEEAIEVITKNTNTNWT